MQGVGQQEARIGFQDAPIAMRTLSPNHRECGYPLLHWWCTSFNSLIQHSRMSEVSRPSLFANGNLANL